MRDLTRRQFLGLAAGSLGASLLSRPAFSQDMGTPVELAQAMVKGSQWLPRPSALRRLSWEIHKRTAIHIGLEPPVVHLRLEDLSRTPFLYLAGDRPFNLPERKSLEGLARFLKYGGFLLMDTAYTAEGDPEGFKRSARHMMNTLSLGTSLKPLPKDHVLYRTFYIVSRPVGRVEGPDHLESITIDGREAVILSDHDLGGAWAKDNFGNWEYEVTPGGQRQREIAFRLGINIVMYSLCLDYKDEKPHQKWRESVGRKG